MVRRFILVMTLLFAAVTLQAQYTDVGWLRDAIANTTYRVLDVGETGPWITTTRFGDAGTYEWRFVTGDREEVRLGTYTISRLVAPGVARIALAYRETTEWDGPPLAVDGAFAGLVAVVDANVAMLHDDRVRQVLYDGPADLHVPQVRISASSELTENTASGRVTYRATNLGAEASLNDFWSEGVVGTGSGETLTFVFSDVESVRGMIVFNGVYRTQNLYDWNARPQTVSIAVEEESTSVVLADSRFAQVVWLERPLLSDTVTLRLENVYEGTRWEDACLTAVLFLADRP